MESVDPVATRELYRPSGGVAWHRFLPLALLALGVGALGGFALNFLFMHATYLLLVFPMGAGLVSAGAAWLAVHKGHCRNPAIAGALGVCVGLLMVPGNYYFNMVELVGPQVAHRLDALPSFIKFRLETDVTTDVGRRNAQPAQPNFWMNVMFFLLEIACATGLPALIAYQTACRPFCERGERWMEKQKAFVPYGALPYIIDAFQSGDHDVLQQIEPIREQLAVPFSELVVHYGCSAEGRLTGDVILEGIDYTRTHNGQPMPDGGAKTIPLWKLSAAEFLTLQESHFPQLGALTTPAADDATFATKRHARLLVLQGPTVTLLDDPPAIGAASQLAMQGTVGAAIVVFFTAVGLVIYGVTVDNPWLGFGSLIFSLAWPLGYLCWFPSFLDYWRQQLVKAKLQHRVDRIVDPTDPEAFFVSYLPRENWESKSDEAWDLGYARIDTASRRLLFEGDASRWNFAAPDIESWNREYISKTDAHNGVTTNSAVQVVCLIVRLNGERHELPLKVMPRRDGQTARTSVARAELFANQLQAISTTSANLPD